MLEATYMRLVNLPRLVLYQLVFSAAERLIVSLKLMVILVISHNDLNCDDFLNPLTPKSDKYLISPYNITL